MKTNVRYPISLIALHAEYPSTLKGISKVHTKHYSVLRTCEVAVCSVSPCLPLFRCRVVYKLTNTNLSINNLFTPHLHLRSFRCHVVYKQERAVGEAYSLRRGQ